MEVDPHSSSYQSFLLPPFGKVATDPSTKKRSLSLPFNPPSLVSSPVAQSNPVLRRSIRARAYHGSKHHRLSISIFSVDHSLFLGWLSSLYSFMDRHAETASGVAEFVEDVVLWRRGDASACVLAATVSAWLLFGSGGYTLLSLASNVLLLLLTVLFLWAKAARLLNRTEPPIPEMRVSQQVVNEVAALLHSGLNTVFSAFHDIALGRDSLLFYQVFLCLWIISILGSLTDFPTFCYTNIVAVLTIPALYQKYEECIDRYMRFAYRNLQMYEMVYERFSMKCVLRARNWVIEVLKEP